MEEQLFTALEQLIKHINPDTLTEAGKQAYKNAFNLCVDNDVEAFLEYGNI